MHARQLGADCIGRGSGKSQRCAIGRRGGRLTRAGRRTRRTRECSRWSPMVLDESIVVGRVKRDGHETDDAAVGRVVPLVVRCARRHKGAATLAPEQELAPKREVKQCARAAHDEAIPSQK